MAPPCCRTSSASAVIPTNQGREGYVTFWKQINSVDQTLENVALGKSQQPFHIHEHAELHPAAARKNGHVYCGLLIFYHIIISVCSHSSALLYFFETGSLYVALTVLKSV